MCNKKNKLIIYLKKKKKKVNIFLLKLKRILFLLNFYIVDMKLLYLLSFVGLAFANIEMFDEPPKGHCNAIYHCPLKSKYSIN